MVTTDKKLPHKRWRRRLRIVLGTVIVSYLVIGLAVWMFQDWIIFPGWFRQGTASTRLIAQGSQRLVKLSLPDGTPIAGMFGPPLPNLIANYISLDHSTRRPTVLFFTGNGSCAAESIFFQDCFRRMDCNGMVVDYAGFGMSGGKPSEANCYATADAALDWLLKQPEVDGQQIIYAGWSLGGAVAIDLAARRPPMKLITFSTFTSMPNMARNMFPWLPTSLMLSYRFDSISKMPRITCPILLIHGLSDSIAPNQMADELAAAVSTKGQARAVKIPGDHEAIAGEGADFWAAVAEFIHSPQR